MAAGNETILIPALDFGGASWRPPGTLRNLSANADGASFQIKIIPGERGDLSPAERREGLERQERLPPIWHQIDKGVELVEGQRRPFGGPSSSAPSIRHGLTMINSSSVTAVFKIAGRRRYDLATNRG